MKSKIFKRTTQLSDLQKVSQAIHSQNPARGGRAREYVAPQTAVQHGLAEIWTRLLKLDRVGIHDNFFELGGNSLIATQVMARVRQTYHTNLPLRAVFESPTIARLADTIERSVRSEHAVHIAGVPRGRDLPLSLAQQRLWFLDQLEPGSPRYNIPQAIRLKGRLDSESLERSFQAVVERHESLRTSFINAEGGPKQRIAAQLQFSLTVIDVSSGTLNTRESEARRLAREEAQQPFDLALAPLMRAKLVRLAPDDHLLLITMHHIVSDRWSFGVLSEELSANYSALLQGAASGVAALPIQYADYSVWQRERLQGAAVESDVAYWKQQLKDAPTALELPADRPRPAVQSYHGASDILTLPGDLADRLQQIAQQHGATLYMLLLAGFQVLLSRYSGKDDIVVGSPVAGRNLPETEDLIGFFVNTLVLRGNLAGNPSFTELLARTRESALGAFAHQELPFERVVEALQPERSLSHNPLFQVAFALQNVEVSLPELPGIAAEDFPVSSGITVADLALFVSENENGLRAKFEYSSDLFDPTTITRMMGHFRTMLEGVASDPHQPIATIPILTAEERKQILREWNGTEAALPSQLLAHELIEQHAIKQPNATAIVCSDCTLSYGDLNARANQIANLLGRRGVCRGEVVAVCAGRSMESVVAQFGIMKAGAAFLPIDPEYPADRIAYMIDDSGARVVFVQQNVAESAAPARAEVICLDSSWTEIAGETTSTLSAALDAEDLAYVIYTSGSTGKPKGVEVLHRGLRNVIANWCEMFDLGPGDRCSHLAGPAFDAIIVEIWPTLAAGGTLCIAQDEARLDPGHLLSWLAVQQINIAFLPTPLAEAVLEQPLSESLQLRAVYAAGDRLHRPPRQLLPFRLYNLYGPTENTVCATGTVVEPSGSDLAPSIGRPIANVQAYVLDRNLQPVPAGVPGELCLGGESLARGYRDRPDITAEKFIRNPFSSDPSSRLYRTGDLVRYLPDGNLDFLGRIDEQVKIRGFRIELGEIEAVLASHPAVRAAAVVAREDIPGQKRLVAYLTYSGGQAPTSELVSYLRKQLPEYMVPAAFVTMAALPLTPNGKVDRKAFPAPEGTIAAGEYVPPSNPTEELVANIWSEVLHASRVGRYDNFFELGGHSLLATQVASRLRQALGIELSLRAIFESPTIAALAARIEASRLKQEGIDAPPITAVDRTRALPLSFAQQRLWFLDQLEPNNPFYNIPLSMRLTGELNVDALEWALAEIARRHEVLRTTFTVRDGNPVQVIAPEMNFVLPVVDLSTNPTEQRETDAKRLAEEEARRPFNISRDPMFRAKLIRLNQQEHALVLVMHHIAGDGWSMGVFSREIAALYEARAQGKPSPLPQLSIQYADFAAWQRQWLHGDVLEKQLAYWKEQLAGAPSSLDLPTDRPRPAIETFRGAFVFGNLAKDLKESLAALSRKEGVTLFMTLLAGFQALLSRYTGREDVVVGSPIANRANHDIEDLIGFFVNSLALRTDLSGNPSFRELLKRVREVALGAYAHQHVPFEKLVEELQPERSLSHNPLFQVSFVLQNAPMPPLSLAGLTITPMTATSRTAKFDLTVFLRETADSLVCALEYNTDLFDELTIQRMLGHFETLLRGAVANPDQKLTDLPLLAEQERNQLLVGWNQTSANCPRELVHEMFEAQVERTPDAVALIAGDEKLSYRELNNRSNQLAHYLRERGVGPESLVGVCMRRMTEVVVALLGVLKSGAAYVPMDPSYPKERLAFMLQDSGVRLLLTQASVQESLPDHDCHTVCLDADWNQVAAHETNNLQSGGTPENLVYVIYTSGSTGRPKGAMILHRGLTNYLAWCIKAYDVRPGAPVPLHSSISFDLTVTALYAPLLCGATVELLPEEAGVEALTNALRNAHERSLVKITPAHLDLIGKQLQPSEAANRVRSFIIGGENLLTDTVRFWLDHAPDTVLINEYGPTETVVGCCVHKANGNTLRSASVPIGRPIANTQLYILDPQLQPVPIGIAGELYIGGMGLARGYLNRPELTAERFIPHPFTAEPGARLYKTGDLAHYRADGTIEYLGRIDDQVKVRGYRIELGEIEAVLNEHWGVRQNAVVAREDEPGNKQLVAYVVADPDYQSKREQGSAEEQISQWQLTFEESYSKGADPALGILNITGWNSSYTGQPIPKEQMQEWVDRTVERILELKPRRVLEIGCGTGLLLFRIAPHCEKYRGMDFSRVAVDYVRAQLPKLPLSNVSVEQRVADDFRNIDKGAYDLVILNSVVQYFPSAEYLAGVIKGAAEVLAPGGKIFVGDVRNLAQLEAFRTATEVQHAAVNLTRDELSKRVQKLVMQEEELVLDPSFFYALAANTPGIGNVSIQLKRGQYHTEMNQFRYDVVLEVGSHAAALHHGNGTEWRDWETGSVSLENLRTTLERDRPDVLALASIPDARVWAEIATSKWLRQPGGISTAGEWRDRMRELRAQAVDPEALWTIGRECGYAVEIAYAQNGAEGRCNAVFRRAGAMPEAAAHPVPMAIKASQERHGDFANDPLHAKLARVLVPELRRHLEQQLPEYMVPAAFVVLKSLPLSPNGKVDRKVLPAPESLRVQSESKYVPPRTPVEEVLANVWAELLHLDHVGIEEDFFEVGGHSLLATQVVSRIRHLLNTEVPLRALFEAPTIAKLAARIETLRREQEGLQIPPLVRVSRDRRLPLSFAQQRLWFLNQLEPDNPFYNVPLSLRLKGELRVDALEEAINHIIRRHEVLRTTFTVINDEPVQVIHSESAIQLAVTDLTWLPELEQESEARRLAAEHNQLPFNLSQGPILRASLLRLAADDHVLLMDTHHIATDGWSNRILMTELVTAYESFCRGQQPSFFELAIQYADYAVWQRAWLQGNVLARHVAYWKQQMDGAPPILQLPSDHVRPQTADSRGDIHAQPIPKRLGDSLRTLSRESGATLYMTLMAAFQLLLSYHTQRHDIVIGTDLANRHSAETESLVGFFVNLLPIRTSLAGNPTFQELLQRVRESALGAYTHQDVPFEKLVEELQPERSMSHNPLVQILFVMENVAQSGVRTGALAISGFNAVITSRFDMVLFVKDKEGTLEQRWMYKPSLLELSTVIKMANQYEALLSATVAHPDASLSFFYELLTEHDKQQRTSEHEQFEEISLQKLKTRRRTGVKVQPAASSAEAGD